MQLWPRSNWKTLFGTKPIGRLSVSESLEKYRGWSDLIDPKLNIDQVDDIDEAKLLKICQAFIKKQEITCAETIHQCDWVIENALEFIEDICDVVGYVDYEYD